MGVSLYPVLNQEVPGFDVTEMSGKALSAAVFAPDSAFAVLTRFSSMAEDELRELIADQTGQDPKEITVPAEEWFAPSDGLIVLRQLFTQPAPLIEGASAELGEWIINDLRSMEKVLVLAHQHGALFHSAMDF